MIRDDAAAAWVQAKVREFEKPLMLYALRIVHNEQDAQDAVQETFLRLCAQDRSAIQNHVAEWLFTVCRNSALNIRTSESRMREKLNEHPLQGRRTVEPALELAVRDETLADVMNALDTLPQREQEVIWLKFYQGLSYREIAQITGVTVNHVGVLMHFGLKKIRERLTAMQESPRRTAEGGT
jgi:RNA polymerase sigma factor (sigma-70 family)